MVSSNTPQGEGGGRRPPRPGRSVNPESAVNQAEIFEVLVDEIRALNSTMRNMERSVKESLDAEARFSTNQGKARAFREASRAAEGGETSLADRPSEDYNPTAGVSRDAINAWTWRQHHEVHGTQQSGMSLGPSFQYFVDPGQRMTNPEATQSLSHFQTWAAQRIGERVAGHKNVYNTDLRGGDGEGGQSMFPRMRSNREQERFDRERAEHEGHRTAGHTTSTDDGYTPRHARTPKSHASPVADEEYTPRHGADYTPRHAREPMKHARPKHAAPEGHDPMAGMPTATSTPGAASGASTGAHALHEVEGAVEGAEEAAGGVSGAAGTAASLGTAAMRTRIGSAIAQSGGTMGGLAAAAKRIPMVGLTLGAVTKGTEFYQEQREQAREYQSMTGSTGAEGWVDKRREDVHRWSNYFKFGGDRAREQFQTATAAGYNDLGTEGGYKGSRAEALDFMDRSYHQSGMDTDESGQFAEAAARNTYTELDELNRTLERLGKAAGEAGINAEKARQNFLGFYESMNAAGQKRGALEGASTMTQAQINYGKAFEDYDFSGQLDFQNQIMVSAQTGMELGEVQALARENPGELLSLSAENLKEKAEQMMPDVTDAIKQAIQGRDISSENETQMVVNELLGEGGALHTRRWVEISAINSITGNQFQSETELVHALIKEYAGQGLGAAADMEAEAAAATQPGTAGEVAGAGGSNLTRNAQEKGALNVTSPGTSSPVAGMSDEEAAEKLDEIYSEDAGYWDSWDKGKHESATLDEMASWGQSGFKEQAGRTGNTLLSLLPPVTAYRAGQALITGNRPDAIAKNTQLTGASKAYQENYVEQGQSDPFLEALLQNTGDHKKAKVSIPTAEGDKVVSLEDAITNYADQLASGQVEFVEGDMAGQSTEQVAGMSGRGDLSSGESVDDVGQSQSEWAEENPDIVNERRQNVVIDLTPEAARVFQINGGETDPSAAAGTPPDMNGSIDVRGGTQFPTRNNGWN